MFNAGIGGFKLICFVKLTAFFLLFTPPNSPFLMGNLRRSQCVSTGLGLK